METCPRCAAAVNYADICPRCNAREYNLHDVREIAHGVYSMTDLFGMHDDPAIIYPRGTTVRVVAPEAAEYWIAVNGRALGITMEPRGCVAQADDFCSGLYPKHGEIYTTHKPASDKAWKAWEKKWTKRTMVQEAR